MKEPTDITRKMLKDELAKVFNEKINTLPSEMQDILLDDLVTAFENRVEVFDRIQPSMQFHTSNGMMAQFETTLTRNVGRQSSSSSNQMSTEAH